MVQEWERHRHCYYQALLYESMIRSTITHGSVVFTSATKTQLEKLHSFQNKKLHRFTRRTRYVRNDTIRKDLNIRPFAEIKKITIIFHNSVPWVQNAELEAIPIYDVSMGIGRKRPFAILQRDDHFDFCSKTSVRNPSGVT